MSCSGRKTKPPTRRRSRSRSSTRAGARSAGRGGGRTAQALEPALKYAGWAALSRAGREKHRAGVLFKAPHKLDAQRLVPVVADQSKGFTSFRLPDDKQRQREGFALTDAGTDLT